MALMVRVNGSARRNSRTSVLIDAVGDAIAAELTLQNARIDFSSVGPEILSALVRDRLSPEGERAVQLAECADLLIVGTPVYRASYSGILKHFFDMVDKDVMRGRIAVLAATGGTPLHGLMLEHQLRPLMAFFSMHTVPTTLYAVESDISDGRIVSPAIVERVNRAAREAVAMLLGRQGDPDAYGGNSMRRRHNRPTSFDEEARRLPG